MVYSIFVLLLLVGIFLGIFEYHSRRFVYPVVTKFTFWCLCVLCTTFGKRFIFTKKSNAAKCFFNICINVIAPCCRKLGVIKHFSSKVFWKLKLANNFFSKNVGLNWYSSMIFLKIPMFFDIENWLWKSKFQDFRQCHLNMKNIKKPFCNIWFFGKNEACANVVHINATK